MIFFVRVALVLMLTGAASGGAFAQLAVDRLWVDFERADAQSADILVLNNSADRYYISIMPEEVHDAGLPGETRTGNADPEALGLLVAPNRMILEPGETRAVRVVRLDVAPDQDRIYRIRIEPQVGDVSLDETGDADQAMGLRVLAAYDILVTSRPPAPVYEIEAVRSETDLTLMNAGHSNILLTDIRVCPERAVAPQDENGSCQPLGSARLYSAANLSFTLDGYSGDAVLRATAQPTLSSDPYPVEF